MRKLLMHSFRSLFSSSGPSKVSRSFNRDKFPRRDAFPPPLPESRKRRRQSELQIEKYIIRTSHNFYENLSQIFLFMYFYRDGWSRRSAAIAQFEEHNRKISRFLSIIAYSYLFTEACYLLPVTQGSITGKIDDDQFGSTRSRQKSVAFTNSMSRLFIRASESSHLSSHSSAKVRQIELLNGKRFQLIANVVRLATDLIAKVTVAYLIPFIVKIPSFPRKFFF